MNYIVFDLEATCWKERSSNQQNEVIEIGAVKLNDQGKIIEEFSEFIKPMLNPILSEFCKELTTIQQIEIDDAEEFSHVIENFKSWIGKEYLLCSWGIYDRKQLIKDCELNGLDSGWVQKHISLKHQYTEFKNLRRPIGMGGALKMENLSLKGTHHRGIDDAKNIAQIFIKHLNNWILH